MELAEKIGDKLASPPDQLAGKKVVETITNTARTGKIGDGKIFVFDLGQVIQPGDECAGIDARAHIDLGQTDRARERRADRALGQALFGAVKRGVDQHDDPDAHAQFPLDISPRISSWRQFIYFSDHLHQRSGLS